MHRLFVYGTLRKGERNALVLSHSRWLGAAQTAAAMTMRLAAVTPYPYPAVDPEPRSPICGELYEVDGPTLATVDELEGHPHWFTRVAVRLADGGDAWMYVAAQPNGPILPPGDWCQWDQPRAGAAAVLGVFAHPDDEAYAAGGLLARCAKEGAQVHLLTATRGELGSRKTHGSAQSSDRRALAWRRTAELEAAAAALGAAAPRFLDLPDGALAQVEQEVLVDALVAQLDRVAPQVVVSLGADGVYGHLDHTTLTTAVTTAVARRPPTCLLLAAFPRGRFAALERAFRRSFPTLSTCPEAVGIARAQADLVLGVADVAQQKLAAIMAHQSQHGGNSASFLGGVVPHLLAEEWYTVGAGSLRHGLPPALAKVLAASD